MDMITTGMQQKSVIDLAMRNIPSEKESPKEIFPAHGDIFEKNNCIEVAGPSAEKAIKEGDFSPQKKKWTLLVYSAADNNLLTYMFTDINEMEVIGSNDKMNIADQFDEGRLGAKRYLLKKDNDQSKITSPVLATLGKINMADPMVLSDFIKWGVKEFPAEHYALIISDHGEGWQGAIEDDSHEDQMKTPLIRAALENAEKETGVKLDVIGFDACLMGSTEVAYELRNNARYFIASEESEGAAGWPYNKILTGRFLNGFQERLKERLNITPEEFAKKIVEDSGTTPGALPTMSSVDLSKMDSLAKATDKLAEKILESKNTSIINNIADNTESFFVFKDQYDFCKRLVNSDSISDEIKDAAKNVMNVIEKDVVIKERHSEKHPNAHGLHIELHSWGNISQDEWWPTYGDLSFSKDTKWHKALKMLAGEKV